jgi:hypothetical protein
MAVLEIEKDPNSRLDYGFTWADWLVQDTIVASEWIVPSDLTNILDYFTDTDAIIWLEGGVVGNTYEITNHITTAAGREEDRSLIIIMKER